MSIHTFRGTVVNRANGAGVASLRVEAWDARRGVGGIVAAADTDAEGGFAIEVSDELIERIFGDRTPQLFFRVVSDTALLASTERSLCWTPTGDASGSIEIVPTRNLSANLNRTKFILDGTYVDPTGGSVDAMSISVETRQVTGGSLSWSETFAGTAQTDERGRFRLLYNPGAPSTIGLELRIRARTSGGTLRATLQITRPPARTVIELVRDDVSSQSRSLFSQLADQLPAIDATPTEFTGDLADHASRVASRLRADIDAYAAGHAMAADARSVAATTPELYFGLARAGLPATLDELFTHRLSAMRGALLAAADAGHVSSGIRDSIDTVMESLEDVGVAVLSEPMSGGLSVGELLSLTSLSAPKHEPFIRRVLKHEGDGADFWSSIASAPEFDSDERELLSFAVQAAPLLGSHAPMISAVLALHATTFPTLQSLAKWSEDDWLTAIEALPGAKFPPFTPGMNDDKRMENYAKTIATNIETRFRTGAISRGEQANESGSATATFLATGDGATLDFAVKRVSKFVADLSSPPAGGVATRLKQLERLHQLTSNYVDLKNLDDLAYPSAAAVHAEGRAKFIVKATGGGISEQSAKQIYKTASYVASASVLIKSMYSPSMNKATTAVEPNPTPAEDPPSEFPDWAGLFGTADACACGQCQSVFSPSAYLVDVLDFLGRNPRVGSSDSALDAFFERRPDIKFLSLTCGNAETALPYVDLVNEIMEVRIAVDEDPWPSDPAHLETKEATNVLLAEPEEKYGAQRAACYADLATANFPLSVPFHFWHEEARVYLEHLGVRRAELIRALATNPSDSGTLDAYAMETLRLAPAAWALLSGTETPDEFELWGFGAGETTWQDTLEEAPEFLRRGELSFDELREWITTLESRAGGSALTLAGVDDCDVSEMTIDNLSGQSDPALAQHALVLRLRRALGWSLTETDKAFTQFGVRSPEKIRKYADAHLLQQRLQLTPTALLALWGDIDHRENTWTPSLYETVFMNPAVQNPPDADFKSLFMGGSPTATIDEKLPAIQAALGASARDLQLLTNADVAEREMALPAVQSGNVAITYPRLSKLFRALVFARATRLSIAEVLVLEALSGVHPLSLGTTASPADTRAFLDVADKLGAAGLSVEMLNYVLRDVATANSTLRPAEATVAGWITELSEGVANASQSAARRTDPDYIQIPILLERLGVSPSDRNKISEILVGTSAGDRAAQSAYVDDIITPLVESPILDAPDGATVVDLLVGAATASPHLLPAGAARFDFVVKRLARRVDSTDFVAQYVAAALKMEVKSAIHLLSSGALKWGTAEAIVAFVPGGAAFAPAATEEVRQELLLRLYKTSLLIGQLRIGPREVETIFVQAAGDLPFLEINELPVEPADAADPLVDAQAMFAAVVRLADLARVRDAWPGGVETLYDVFAAAATETLAQVLERITKFGGYNAPDIATGVGVVSLTTQFGYATREDFKSEAPLVRFLDARGHTDRLGVSAAVAIGWTDLGLIPSAAALVSAEIKRAARAKHSDDGWLDVARPLRDALRDKQRRALAAVLVHRLELEDTNALYEHLLVDAEMSPCQLTSRIVLAQSSVQLFIQRALLSLEKETFLPDEDAARDWRWMKYYRVWEANRRVFCYPENWITPELRSDKTQLFSEFESALLRGPLTTDAIERAYGTYLDHLHVLAHLEVIAMTVESVSKCDGTFDVVHVIGRTVAPRQYFYRSRSNGLWSPWEKVDLEIDSEHLMPCVVEGRLHLFWSLIDEVPIGQSKYQETRIRLGYARRETDRWTGPKISFASGSTEAEVRLGLVINPSQLSFVSAEAEPGIALQCLCSARNANIGNGDPLPSELAVVGTFNFDIGTNAIVATPGARPSYSVGGAIGSASIKLHFGPQPVATVPIESVGRGSPFYQGYILRNFSSIALLVRTAGTMQNVELVATSRLVTDRHHEPKDEERYGFINSHTSSGYFFAQRSIPQPGTVSIPQQFGLPPTLILTKPDKKVYRLEASSSPYIVSFRRALGVGGLDGLLRWADQSPVLQLQSDPSYFDPLGPHPLSPLVELPYPNPEVDFTPGSPFGVYHWELFFHAPFYIAKRLSQDGQFEEASRWFHYIFDPTDGSPSPEESPTQRYWKVKPLFLNKNLETIQSELATPDPGSYAEQIAAWASPALTSTAERLAAQIAAWIRDPFDPDAIARLRPVAYQKAIVKAYIDNLISWGDSKFALDTIESIGEATQLYVLAATMLGKRPTLVTPATTPSPQTYLEITASNPLAEVESTVPLFDFDFGSGFQPTAPFSVFRTDAFCVPANDMLMSLWDTVSDRLFKIRHCQNIDGVVRSLPLFAPPIDPGLLIRARAAGVDISQVLSDLGADLSGYRYASLYSRAVEFTNAVINFGGNLLSVLEKQDAEGLSALRSAHEVATQRTLLDVRRSEVEEAERSRTSIQKSRDVVEERRQFYANVMRRSPEELEAYRLSEKSAADSETAGHFHQVASFLHVFPDITTSFPPSTTFGPSFFARSADAFSGVFAQQASQRSQQAALITTEAAWKRRDEDWTRELNLATKELSQIDAQLVAAEVRVAIATQQLRLAETQLAQAREVDAYLRTKYTNSELYSWMAGQTSALFYQSYKLAFEMARKAERAYQWERGETKTFIQFSSWEDARRGLLSGERLALDLRRLDAAYVDTNKRELELTKMYSLRKEAPEQLLRLRQVGVAEFSLPEQLFDRDFAKHYFRRLVSVAATVHCSTGPYEGVSAELRLNKSWSRSDANDSVSASDRAARTSAVTAIAISHGQGDAGVFELDLRGERYLPFEGAGAHLDVAAAGLGGSATNGQQWTLALEALNEFTYDSIDDLVLTIRYTSRPGRKMAPAATMARQLMVRVRTDFEDAWEAFMSEELDYIEIPGLSGMFSKGHGESTITITGFRVFGEWSGTAESTAPVVYNVGPGSQTPTMTADAPTNWPPTAKRFTPNLLPLAAVSPTGAWRLLSDSEREGLVELWLVVDYTT